jgi:hypothetical protein
LGQRLRAVCQLLRVSIPLLHYSRVRVCLLLHAGQACLRLRQRVVLLLQQRVAAAVRKHHGLSTLLSLPACIVKRAPRAHTLHVMRKMQI